MEINEAYIDKIICHHFSLDPTRRLLNSKELGIGSLDVQTIKSFFINPFGRQKAEYRFVHPVNISYNVVYETTLQILQNKDFVECSRDLFRHLCAVSTSPTIKDGDIFIAKIEDVKIENSYYQGIGVFKIETKSNFIETYVDDNGNMAFEVKSGFASNKIDKACMIVFTENSPTCYLIDNSKDTKFWKESFLGLAPKSNSFAQSKAAITLFQEFIKSELPTKQDLLKDKQVQLINKSTEIIKASSEASIDKIAKELFEDQEVLETFSEYRKAYEEREQINLQNPFVVDKKAVTPSKTLKRIKLDDTSEIYLLKSGPFIERGYDEEKGMRYYKLYFNEER